MKKLAQGIASLGRGKDKMLVHMTPGEVRGLQRIAMAHGGSLTINPKTGLPEAGFLDDVLGFAAPILGGLAFGPIGAGLASGLTSYAKTGDIGKALGAGALGYGGASLLGGVEAEGLGVLNKADAQALMLPEEFATNMATNQGPFDMGLGTEAVAAPDGSGYVNQELPPQTPEQIAKLTDQAMPSANQNFGQQVSDIYAKNDSRPYMDKLGAGFKQITSSGQNAMDFVKNNKLPLAATALGISSMMTPKQADPAAPTLQGTRQDYAYDQPRYDASGRLISAPSYRKIGSTPYYNAAQGGEIRGMAQGGDTAPVGPYGGSTAGPYDRSAREKDEYLTKLIALYSRGQGDLAGATQRPTQKATQRAAQGGIMGMAGGGYTSSATAQDALQYQYNPADQTYTQQAAAAPQGSGNMFIDMAPKLLQAMTGQTPAPKAKQYSYDSNGQKYTELAQGGVASLPNEYAAGGKLLQGPGDGMSDSIPAVIKGARPQRAALAQGEFVIPADVVSHLGNGSTDAGAKRLYAMMDKIRHARTGTKKQGKQINPANFMPA